MLKYVMCGRFVLATPKKISERFSVAGKAPLLQENYNVAPSTKVPVIIQNSPNQAVFMDWGFKWKNNQQGIINIRGESFSEKPFFRNFLSKNRCLVPANGFYEWGFIALENGKKDKYPFYFSLKNSDLFAFAGIYNEVEGKQNFAIITTAANSLVKKIHNRMPVILEKNLEENWLEKANMDFEKINPMLRHFDSKLMKMHIVDKSVNNPSANKKENIADHTTFIGKN